MEESIWLPILGELVSVISGVIFAGISGLGAFYVKKFSDNMKRKSFIEDVTTYVEGVEQSPIYGTLTGADKFKMVFERAQKRALESGISMDDIELTLLVESKVKKMKESEIKALGSVLLETEGSSGSPLVKIVEEEPEIITGDIKAVG